MYHEQPVSRNWHWQLVGIFLLIALPNCWLLELTSKEAMGAMIARDMTAYGNVLRPTMLGVQTAHPPLLAWILSAISMIMPLNEFSVRIVDILCLGGLAWMAAVTVKRLASTSAAGAAAACVFSSIVALQQGLLGEGKMLFALLINAAWLSLYQLSRQRKEWWRAWLGSHGFVFLAMLAGGPKALLYFYVPLLFLRRPLKVRRRMRQWEHLVSFGLLLVIVLTWVSLVPGLWQTIFHEVQNLKPAEATDGYWRRALLYPLRAVGGTLPWLFLLWPAFCLAWRPIEKDSAMAQYMRTIVLSLFWLFWLLPEGKPTYLLPVIGPLGILTGINYDILIRRHGERLQSVGRILFYMALLLCAVAVVTFYCIKTDASGQEIATALKEAPAVFWSSVVFMTVGVVLAIMIMRSGGRRPVWLFLVLGILSFHLVWVSTIRVRVYLSDREKRMFGGEFAKDLPADQPVYLLNRKYGDSGTSLVAECFYLNRLVIQIHRLKDIESSETHVYVLTPDGRRPTGDENLSWTWHSEYGDYEMWRGEYRQ